MHDSYRMQIRYSIEDSFHYNLYEFFSPLSDFHVIWQICSFDIFLDNLNNWGILKNFNYLDNILRKAAFKYPQFNHLQL